jgi:hypothetical protein
VPISQIGRRDKVESAEMSRNSQPPQSPGGDTSPEAPSPEATFESNSATNFKSTSYTAAAQRMPYAPDPSSSSASVSSSSSSTHPASYVPYSQFASRGKSSSYNEPLPESVSLNGGVDDDFDFDDACMQALEKAEKDYDQKKSTILEIAAGTENAHDEGVSQATQLQYASQDTLFHSQQFEGHSQEDDGMVEGHSQGDDGMVEGHSQGDDGMVEGHSQGDDGMADGHSQGENGMVEGHSQGDDGMVEGHSQGDDGMVEGHSQGENGMVEGHSQGDDGMVDGHSQGENGMVEGHSQGDDGMVDDGMVEGHSQGDDGMVEGHSQGDDGMVEGHSQGDGDIAEGHSQGDDGMVEGHRQGKSDVVDGINQPVAVHSPVRVDIVDRQEGTVDLVVHSEVTEDFDGDEGSFDMGGDAVNQVRDSSLHGQREREDERSDENEFENESENKKENKNNGENFSSGIDDGARVMQCGVTEGVIDERIIAVTHTQDAENSPRAGDPTQLDPHTSTQCI